MVHVTTRAREELHRSLTATEREPGISLRLRASGPGQLALVLDQVTQGDQIVEHEGQPLLVIGQELAEPLHGVTIDCEETPEGARLTLSREGEAPGESPDDGQPA